MRKGRGHALCVATRPPGPCVVSAVRPPQQRRRSSADLARARRAATRGCADGSALVLRVLPARGRFCRRRQHQGHRSLRLGRPCAGAKPRALESAGCERADIAGAVQTLVLVMIRARQAQLWANWWTTPRLACGSPCGIDGCEAQQESAGRRACPSRRRRRRISCHVRRAPAHRGGLV